MTKYQAIKIDITQEVPHIPVEFGPLTFKFPVTDASIKKFRVDAQKVYKEMSAIETSGMTEDEAEQVTRDVLAEGYDLMLGKGAFEKCYELVPSVLVLTEHFGAITEGLTKALNNFGDRKSKYIKKK